MQPDDSNLPLGPTYFYEFIKIIEVSYPPVSEFLIAQEIEFARQSGPVAAELQSLTAGVYEMTVPIGFGHMARIELEFDRQGQLQPVIGEIIRR